MLGLGLGRQYRDRVDSGPAIPEQFYTDSEGSACSSPTYGFDLLDLTNATIGTPYGNGVTINDQSSPTNNSFTFGFQGITSATLLPNFQGKNNVIRIVFCDDGSSYLGLNRAGGNIVTRIHQPSNSQLDFSNVAHPDWSHHTELTYWVDTNYENNPNNEISTTISSNTTYGFGGDLTDALFRTRVAASINDPRDKWTTIKLDIFDQIRDLTPSLVMLDGSGSGSQTMALFNLPQIQSDSYPPEWPNPEGYFGPSALYIAGIKHTVCPRT